MFHKLLGILLALASLACAAQAQPPDIATLDRQRILQAADAALAQAPVTITAFSSSRSSGGLHDFYSEGDYWWPDPAHPGGPYIQRDGLTNPDNFVAHRRALVGFSVQVPALVAAWKISGERRYAQHAAAHLRAWFIDPATRLNPNLQYAQAISGKTTGRGIGIIDTVHLVEVARAIEVLQTSDVLSAEEQGQIKRWFTDYLRWLTTSKNGQEERDAKNNHGSCWLLQVAAFAHLTGDQQLLAYARERFKTVLLPTQLAADGSLPLELKRTKPYGYALFDLEALAALCQILSTPQDNLWTYATPDGRSMAKAVAWMAPYIRDKGKWPLPPDVMYDKEWPMRQTSLLFAGRALGKPDYLALWASLPADSTVEEVIRNFFIRQPVLW
ncbi:alginate lyase family protein [Duganella dendranthematis]|uniref:Alginate lyase family protein n=1 Tax=Duganella dendranthematis TaxID=2728021 RepID=A0ABX6MIG5_9BURK|nr:alginate lyase family protein [Duganella dendranthematis]QJD93810.1 alginate lyase family protein [Duganella dendranthematis]